jgi:tape measure domain-containing protein
MANSEQAQYIIELKDLVSSKLDAMNSRLDATNSKFNTVQQKAEGGLGLGKLGAIAGGLFAISKIQEYGSEILSVGSKYESLGIQMNNLTGSAEKGSAMFAQIRADALTSPFGVDELATANTMLVSAGLSADQARGDILALSNAVAYAGKGNDELIRMSANMQQIKNIGKASALDIKQFGYAGINIYGALAKATGKSTEEVKGMEVSYELLSKSLRIASEEGGSFYGGLSSMQDSTAVKMSNLGDISKEMFNDLFLAMKPIIDYGISGFTSFIGVMRKGIVFVKEYQDPLIAFGASLVAIATYNGLVAISANAVAIGYGLASVAANIFWVSATLGLAAIIPAFIVLYQKFEGFRAVVNGLVNVFSMLWKVFKESFIDPFIKIFNGDLRSVITGFSELIVNVLSFKMLRDAGSNFASSFMEGYNETIQDQLYEKTNKLFDFQQQSVSQKLGFYNPSDTFSARLINQYTLKQKNESETKINHEENKKLAKTYENKITNVTIGRLVEGLNVHVMETKEIAPKIKEAITKYLIEAVNNINVVQN